MCASKGTVPSRIDPEQAQSAAYQPLTDPVVLQNFYRQGLGPTLGSDVACPPEPSPPQDHVDPVDARFRGLILEEEKKT